MTATTADLGAYLATLEKAVEQEKVYSNAKRLRAHMEFLFKGVCLKQRRMLDVGGGNGLHSFYAAAMGAEDVVCLEPEAAGSEEGEMNSAFHRLSASLPFGARVKLLPITFQEFESGKGVYDIVLLHNSINHLDEDACIRLQDDTAAQESYRKLFRKMAEIMAPSSTLIVADCSRYNCFPLLGVKNPFAPQIEWDKHQSPTLWAKLLCEIGFRDPQVRWTAFNRLGRIGRLFLGHQLPAYFLISHFNLTMRLAK